MKKTLIALLALTGLTSADVLTLNDHWSFDNNLTSANGKTFIGQYASVSHSDGAANVTLSNSGISGIHLNASNALGLTDGNWAMQLYYTLGATNTTNTAMVLACLDNEVGGTHLCVSNTAQGKAYGMANAASNTAFGSWNDGTVTNAAPAVDTYMALTIVNYNDKLYIANNDEWATFGINSATKQDGLSIGDMDLNRLTLGFGRNGQNGMPSQTMKLYDLSVYTFDSSAVSLADVKSALVPEPATATLSLLALAGLASRRRRR